MTNNNTDIEEENQYNKEIPQITVPFDPRDVNIQEHTYTVSNLVSRMQNNLIDMQPDFQRRGGLWSDSDQSKLIESLIVRIPIPTFYFDSDDNDVLIIVDGLQRLSTIKRFICPDDEKDRLRLTGLEYLTDYKGKSFEDLPANIQARINETNFTSYVIRPGTPDNVKISIFTRINTGGMQLTAAEIRNSVYRGKAAKLLKRMADCEDFKKATRGSVSPRRMLDCEFANRFLAFYILSEDDYQEILEEYLDKALETIKNSQDDKIETCEKAFADSMHTSVALFGCNAFRKIQRNGKFGRINKPLFECVSVSLAKCSQSDRDSLISNKEIFLEKYYNLLKDDSFIQSITSGTVSKESVRIRYSKFKNIIKETLNA